MSVFLKLKSCDSAEQRPLDTVRSCLPLPSSPLIPLQCYQYSAEPVANPAKLLDVTPVEVEPNGKWLQAAAILQICIVCIGNCQLESAFKGVLGCCMVQLNHWIHLRFHPTLWLNSWLALLEGVCRWAVKGGATSSAIAVNLRIGTCNFPEWIRRFLTLSSVMPHLLELGT